MGIFEKKQQMSSGKPEKMPAREEKKDTGFGGKPYLTQEELRKIGRSYKAYEKTGIPEEERMRRLRDLLGEDKTSIYVEPWEVGKRLNQLSCRLNEAKTETEIREIKKDINLLKVVKESLEKGKAAM